MKFEFVNDGFFLNIFIGIDVFLDLVNSHLFVLLYFILSFSEGSHCCLHFLHRLIGDFLVFLFKFEKFVAKQ